MATRNDILPEGTDSIIAGAGVGAEADSVTPYAGTTPTGSASMSGSGSSGGGSPGFASGSLSALKDEAATRVDDLKSQAGDKARDLAVTGKDKATAALDNVAKLVSDAAGQVDEKVGAQYGDYARQAATAVSDLSTQLQSKDVDELFEDVRAFVRQSPAVAIGAAALAGFALIRLLRSGVNPQAGFGSVDRGA